MPQGGVKDENKVDINLGVLGNSNSIDVWGRRKLYNESNFIHGGTG